jgi:predicted GNAT family N-acyltransferase
MELQLIEHGSDLYQKMVELRTEILRKPLGLEYTEAQLKSEKSDYLLVATEKTIVIGCCILTPLEDNQIQLRQMAVANHQQGKGIGAKIVDFAEKTAIQKGFKILILHARKYAVGFYQKLGYETFGDEYVEVGIPHFSMKKSLV